MLWDTPRRFPPSLLWQLGTRRSPCNQVADWELSYSVWTSLAPSNKRHQLFSWSTALWDTIIDCQDLYAEIRINHLVTGRTLPTVHQHIIHIVNWNDHKTFSFDLVNLAFDLWPWPSNMTSIFFLCTSVPKFKSVCLSVWPGEWDGHTHRQTTSKLLHPKHQRRGE